MMRGERGLTLTPAGLTRETTGPSPGPSPVGRGVVCEVTPTGLLAWGVVRFFSHAGEFFLSQSAQRSLSFLAHISSPQKASGIQNSQRPHPQPLSEWRGE